MADWLRHHLFGPQHAIALYPIEDPRYQTRLDGVRVLHDEQLAAVDMYNPQTGRDEQTMWTFCNNHDQWRMQALVQERGQERFLSCVGWLTFWPGVPLHYAGDEQAFRTFGTAARSKGGRLDGAAWSGRYRLAATEGSRPPLCTRD